MAEEQTAELEGFRLSPQQRRLWAEGQRHGDGWQGALVAVVLDGAFDPERLRMALEHLVEDHEILRTRLFIPPGAKLPLQWIGEPSIEWISLDGEASILESKELDEESLASLVIESIRRDLPCSSSTPPLRVFQAALGESKHLLVLSLSAICADSTGVYNLVQELEHTYRLLAASDGEAEGDILQYADLAEWQNELVESEETVAGRAFWQELGWASLEPAALPFGKPSSTTDFDPRSFPLSLDPELIERLRGVARSRDGSISTLFLTCWQILLWRLGGGGEFVMAVAKNGRRYEELADAVGPMSRSLPFICRLARGRSSSELLRDVVEQDQNAVEWQEYFDVGELGADAAFHSVQFESLEFGDVERGSDPSFCVVRLESREERFAIALRCQHWPGKTELRLHYDASMFSDEEVELLAGRFEQLLSSVAADPEKSIESLSLLNPAERQRLLVDLNPQPRKASDDVYFHRLFAQQAASQPQSPALVAAGTELTYGELQAQATRLAHYLASLGAGPDQRIAVCFERTPELVISLLAVLETGAAYVPLEPGSPRDRTVAMLQDSAASILLAKRELLPGLALDGVRSVAFEEASAIQDHPTTALDVDLDPASLAYVIFTSGSTGRPKAVGVAHRQLSSYLLRAIERLDLPPNGSYATVSTFTADLGHTMIFPALATGGCLHAIATETAADPGSMAVYLREHPVDCLKIVPSHLSALLGASTSRDLLPRRRLILGGEAFHWELLEQLRALEPACTIFNHYGPTESTVGAVAHRVDAPKLGSATVPLGRPLDHVRVDLLDATMQLAPLGTPAEIYLGGNGLARGYLQDPALTAERFVPDSHSGEIGARCYRTGDKAQWLASGDLEFLGRIDDQLKIRGFRVEPREVEKVLVQHPAVAAAKVVGFESAPGDLRLAAYLAVDPIEAGPLRQLLELRSDGQLRGRMLEELPNGMVVAHLNDNETSYLFREIFAEKSYFQHGVELPAREACVFDVGANIGFFSLQVARTSAEAKIFAFEPVPPTFDVLRLNAQLYGNGNGIHVFDCGLSRENRETQITHYPHLSLMSSLYADREQERDVVRSFLLEQQGDNGHEVPEESLLDELLEDRLQSEDFVIPLRRLSDVIREQRVSRIDLLKIDAQKSEGDILAGIDEEDWAKIHQIVLEVHDLEGRLGEITALLETRGYDVVVDQEEGLTTSPLYMVYARRPAYEPARADGDEPAKFPWSNPVAMLDDVRRRVRENLPEHMVPATLTLLPRLPLTANGKVDVKALPEPEETRLEQRREVEEPRTATEKKIKEIWAGILGFHEIGINENFFEIGGHSLLATRVIARIRDAFDFPLSLRGFFESSTIASLAHLIETAGTQPQGTPPRAERIQRAPRDAYRRQRSSTNQ